MPAVSHYDTFVLYHTSRPYVTPKHHTLKQETKYGAAEILMMILVIIMYSLLRGFLLCVTKPA